MKKVKKAENCYIYSCEILQFIAWACFRNVLERPAHVLVLTDKK